MADVSMAAYTFEGLIVIFSKVYLLDDVAMAVAAIGFGYFAVELGDLNGFVEITGGKSQRMMVAIAGLCVIFRNQRVGGMAIVACGNGMMATFAPRVEMVLHDMTIRTDTWFVAEVRESLRIDKGIRAYAQAGARRDRKNRHA